MIFKVEIMKSSINFVWYSTPSCPFNYILIDSKVKQSS